MGRANNRISFIVADLQQLAGAHIDKPEGSLLVNHHVFRLEITVDDVLVVEILNAEDHGRHVELGVCRLKQSDLSDNIEQLHAANVLHQEIDVKLVLVRTDVF